MERDWRIGLSVKPKYRGHELYYEHGEVVEVLPSGTGGLVAADGILKIRMESGRTLLARAHEWVTA